MSAKNFYVLIIGPGGEENYVKCDPSRLARNSFRLYEKTTVRDGLSKFTAVNGSEGITRLDEVDVTLPVETFKEIKEQCRDTLVSQGEHGERLFNELFEALDLSRLMCAIAKSDVDEAQEAVQAIMYGIMGLANRCACELADTHRTADHVTSAMESIGSVLDAAPLMNREIYLNWSAAADGLNGVVVALREFEDQARRVLTDVERAQKEWLGRMDISAPIIHDAYQALEKGEDAFIFRALSYRGEPDQRDEMLQAVSAARVHVQACRKLERACQDAWDKTIESAQQTLGPLQAKLPKLLAGLKDDTRRLSDFEKQYGMGVARPHLADRELIDEEQYQRALAHLCDEAWGPLACERRLRHLCDNVLALCGMRPELPAELAKAIKMAERYANEAVRYVQEGTVPDDPAPAAEPCPQTLAVATDDENKAAGARPKGESPTAAAVPQRVDELYRLMTAVAYVITVENTRTFTSFTMNSLLRVLVKMGKCTVEEAMAAKEGIRVRYKEESVKAESAGKALSLQKTTKKRWIRFKLRAYVAKLSRAYGAEAKRTMSEHGMTSQGVRAALAQAQAEAKRIFNERRTSNGGEEEESDD